MRATLPRGPTCRRIAVEDLVSDPEANSQNDEPDRPTEADPGTSVPQPSAQAHQAPEQRRGHSRWWIVATLVFAVIAIGLGAWALSLRSDNDDKDAQIADQQQQLEEQQGVAGQVRETARGVTEDAQQALSELGAQLDDIQRAAETTQEDTQQAIDQAKQAAADAKQEADQAADELDKARAEADEAGARADEAAACARGYVSAIGSAFDADSIEAGVERAKTEIESLQGSCSGVLGGS
jgi:hypothetical protein